MPLGLLPRAWCNPPEPTVTAHDRLHAWMISCWKAIVCLGDSGTSLCAACVSAARLQRHVYCRCSRDVASPRFAGSPVSPAYSPDFLLCRCDRLAETTAFKSP